MTPERERRSNAFAFYGAKALALLAAGCLVLGAYLASGADGAVLPPKCSKTITRQGVTLNCTLANPGSFWVVGHSNAGYDAGYDVWCKNVDVGTSGETVNGAFAIAVDKRHDPQAYRLMANCSVPVRIFVRFTADNPGAPHNIYGTIKWTHYLGVTLFHD